jgi:hypothetical protein
LRACVHACVRGTCVRACAACVAVRLGGMPDIGAMMNDPNMRQMAEQMRGSMGAGMGAGAAAAAAANRGGDVEIDDGESNSKDDDVQEIN